MSAAAATTAEQQQPPQEQEPDPPAAPAPAGMPPQPPPPAHEEQQELQQEEEQAVSSPRDPEQQCHICMSSMREPTAVKGCGHRFCRSCIGQWVSTRQQPACPVCRADVTTLVLEDGTEQAAEPAAAAPPAEAEPDLSCLDHTYFLAEVSRLQSRAQSVHNCVYRDAYGCGRRGGAHQTGLLLDGVQDVMDLLSGYRSSLEGEVRFDPQMLLQELYRLDTQLTSLQAGDSNSGSAAAAAPAGVDAAGGADPWQQQAVDSLTRMNIHDADYSHEHSDHEHDYDYDSEEDWHEGLSRTPGRRPTQRHVVRHGRSNSGGSQQQRQGQGQGQQQRQQLTPQLRGPMPRWRQGVGQSQGQGRQRGGGGNGPTGL